MLPEAEDTPIGMRSIPSVNTEHGAAYIAIRKLENYECVFLSDNLCMIHQFRPSVCRSFPFVFQKKDDAITWGLSAMKDICPGIGIGPEITTAELDETADPVIRELTIYRDFVKEWNAKEANPTARSLIEAILSDPRFAI